MAHHSIFCRMKVHSTINSGMVTILKILRPTSIFRMANLGALRPLRTAEISLKGNAETHVELRSLVLQLFVVTYKSCTMRGLAQLALAAATLVHMAPAVPYDKRAGTFFVQQKLNENFVRNGPAVYSKEVWQASAC